MKALLLLATVLLAAACHRTEVCEATAQPVLFPDYRQITIPCNIAPLNFTVPGAGRVEVRITSPSGRSYRFTGRRSLVRFPLRAWRRMLASERGRELTLRVTADTAGRRIAYRSFTWRVADEPIDRYLSYRRIEPAYEVWNLLQIRERDLTGFGERVLADNRTAGRRCMNCHTVGRGGASLLHVRGEGGGTIFRDGETLRKIATATEQTGPAVYGEIDASGRYGIFTTADILPILHTFRTGRMEVYDRTSALILIDFERQEVIQTPAMADTTVQQTFPCFAPDGRSFYFCRARRRPQPDSTTAMHYDLYRTRFDPATGRPADEPELIWEASAEGLSVSFPRISPDGRRLLCCTSDYGTFPIWHPETDLCMIDLHTGRRDSLPQVNGPYADSWHSWSSNGRWFVFASKRDDRVHGRSYIAYVDREGRVSKPFLLPLRNPDHYRTTLRSQNIPELYAEPESYNARTLQRLLQNHPAETLRYRSEP